MALSLVIDTEDYLIEEVSPERAREMGFYGYRAIDSDDTADMADITHLPNMNLFRRDIITIYEPGRANSICLYTSAQSRPIEACCQVNPDSRSFSIVRTSK